MIVILTKKPKEHLLDIKFYLSEIKYLLKDKIQGVRGPKSVILNLVDGLNKIGVDFKVDPKIIEIHDSDTLCVLRDINALKFAINLKRRDSTKKIFAGPNIITIPNEENYLIFNNLIDSIIVPSKWVKEFYSKFTVDSLTRKRIVTWASGICIPQLAGPKEKFGILYKKNVPDDLFKKIKKYLINNNLEFKVFKYGQHSQNEFFKFLKSSKWMIYLQESESQGISMIESWAHDVSTFVWNNNYFKYPNTEYVAEGMVSAPYLSNKCGQFFDDYQDFLLKFNIFLENLPNFSARTYAIRNFDNKVAAQKYLDIIYSKNHDNHKT